MHDIIKITASMYDNNKLVCTTITNKIGANCNLEEAFLLGKNTNFVSNDPKIPNKVSKWSF